MKKIKIFLGSSIVEFEKERNELELFIRNLSDKFEDNYNIKIVPLRCENMDNYVRVDGTQSAINEELVRESDMCFFIFFTKVGEFTEEEFRVALEKFKQDGKPKIYIYFKTIPDGVNVDKSIRDFMMKIDEELKHYHGTFDHIDTIKLRLLLNLKIQEMDFVSIKVEGGKVLVDGNAELELKRINEFANSNSLQQLNEELLLVEEEYYKLKSLCSEDSVDNSLFQRYAKVATKRQTIIDSIAELEKIIFSVSFQLCKDEVYGEITPRQKQAYKLFEMGDYQKCLAVLDSEEINKDFYSFERKELEKIHKRAQVFVHEHNTAIKVLELMFGYSDRFNQIADRYNTIIPIIKQYMVALDVWLDYICFLFAEQDYDTCFDEIKQFIKIDFKSKSEKDLGCFEKQLKSVLFGIVHNSILHSDKNALIMLSKELELLMKYNTTIIAPYLQICYVELGKESDRFTDLLDEREEASMYFQKAVDVASIAKTKQTVEMANIYKRYVTRKFLFHSRELLYTRFVHQGGVSFRVIDSTLYIYGEGAMKDFLITFGPDEDDDVAPWSDIVGITSVVIEEGVQYIGDYAFAYNKGIEEVIIPSTVCDMGLYVFSGCDNLKSIYVNPKNRFYRSVDGVLFDYSYKKLVFVPNRLVNNTFEIPKHISIVGGQSFSYNHNLKEIVLSDSIKRIGSGAFEKCDQLNMVQLPSNLDIIASHMFSGCKMLEEIHLPDSIRSIEAAAFANCGIKDVLLSGIKHVKRHTFANCAKLKKVVFAEGIKTIGYESFAGCILLQEISFPSDLEYIDPEAFWFCPELKVITFQGNEDEWKKKTFSILFPEDKFTLRFLR